MVDDDRFPVFAEWARKRGVDEAAKTFKSMLPTEVLAAYVSEYQDRVSRVEAGNPPVLSAARDPWYGGPTESDVYWPRLAKYFASDLGWTADRIEPVDHASSKVIAQTPRPETDSWTSKGLVVGYVQSGKTTNFTSVIAKAADVGYKLVIVLSGIHNGLRRQTQERLDTQLKDLESKSWLTLTDTDEDFRAPRIKSTALLHGQESKIALCVVKKNAAVLRRLDKWLEDAAKQHVLADLPTLMIDDEADQASVQTRTINPLVRSILDKLPRCTYIGYTATPFANVLIDPSGDDLYPKDFILNLPRPEGYFGTERIFGRDAVEGDEAVGTDLDGFDLVRIITDDEVESLTPVGKAAAAGFAPDITPSLESAVRWFWLATATRRARGDEGHSTMLIHTSMKIAVHESYRDPLLDLRDDMVGSLDSEDPVVRNQLRSQWESETARVPASDFASLRAVDFDEVLTHLRDAVATTKIILDNCRSEDRLDYSQPSQIAIAIGGNTLSRGLTLEGLVVSFFVRAAKAYDTLLQMARWFGFRPGYEDLPRIWMTDQLRTWFRHLATVEHEIRLDIDRYEQQGLTPLEFGVRIRTHPILRITAKMGRAKTAYASYGGRRVQTRYFRENDDAWLRNNLKAADELVRSARASAAPPETLEGGGTLYRSVAADVVDEFLASYTPHPDSPDLDPDLVRSYVANQRAHGSLELWSVAVMAGDVDGRGIVRCGGVDFNRIGRSKLRGSGPDRADIKTLMSKDHRVVDLPISLKEARGMNESVLMTARNEDPTAKNRGLLLIYPIDPHSEPDFANIKNRSALEAVDEVIGMALVFPGNAEAKVKATHVSVDLSDAEIEEEEAEMDSLLGESV